MRLSPSQSLFKIVAVAFSTIGLYTGITPLYGFGLLNGGAVGVVWGWLVVCFFMSFVALAMAEICSSYPVRSTRASQSVMVSWGLQTDGISRSMLQHKPSHLDSVSVIRSQ